MKANELMIGDWVRRRWTCTDTGREVVRDFQITEIRKNGETLYAWGKSGNMGRVEELVPIPITAEILEKNGIKLKEVGDNGMSTPPEWRNRFEKWVLRTQWKDTFIWYDRTAKYWHLYDNMGAAKLLYVHELQHALRLCGIEKEIEL